MNKLLIFLLPNLIVFSFISCVSVETTSKIYDATVFNQITEWFIGFKYDITEIEETQKIEGENEITIKKGGQFANDLQILDDIYFYLKDNYNLKINRDIKNIVDKNYGKILLHTSIDFSTGDYLSIDIEFMDYNDDLIARLKMTNTGIYSNKSFVEDAIKETGLIFK